MLKNEYGKNNYLDILSIFKMIPLDFWLESKKTSDGVETVVRKRR